MSPDLFVHAKDLFDESISLLFWVAAVGATTMAPHERYWWLGAAVSGLALFAVIGFNGDSINYEIIE
jgi:hypothetical protein